MLVRAVKRNCPLSRFKIFAKKASALAIGGRLIGPAVEQGIQNFVMLVKAGHYSNSHLRALRCPARNLRRSYQEMP